MTTNQPLTAEQQARLAAAQAWLDAWIAVLRQAQRQQAA